MRENASPLSLLLFPLPRACARLCVCEVSVAGWLLVVVVGWFRGRSNPPRYPLTLNLNGLLLRCCLTVPLSTVELQSDSLELLVVFGPFYRLSAVLVYGLNNTMAGQGSPAISGGGGFTPINRSPGNDSMSSGLPVQDDKKRRSGQVAAVVGCDRAKASPEPQ